MAYWQNLITPFVECSGETKAFLNSFSDRK